MRWEHIRTMQSITELIVPNSCQFLFGLSRLFSDLSLDFSLMFFNRYRLQPYNNFPCPYFACRCFAIIHPPDPSCPLFLPSLASVGYSSVRSSLSHEAWHQCSATGAAVQQRSYLHHFAASLENNLKIHLRGSCGVDTLTLRQRMS